jgi:PucR C-terminal helix-turn-helix domain/GGDEF-like domain
VSAVQSALQAHTRTLDRLREVLDRPSHPPPQGMASHEQERLSRLREFLSGQGTVETADFNYDFNLCHLGLIGQGSEARTALRRVAAALDLRSLLVPQGEGTTWAWFGGRSPASCEALEKAVRTNCPQSLSFTLGEPAFGLSGFRLTHLQALAALPLVHLRSTRLVRYADEAILLSMLRDELLVDSMRSIYLAPLEAQPDGGEGLRETLREYFRANRNASSAAQALRVNRRTVTYRLRKVEELLDRPLPQIATDVELALRLHAVQAD